MAYPIKKSFASRLSGIRLNLPISLWKKEYVVDKSGGNDIQWVKIKDDWGKLTPSAARYPLIYEDQKHYRGAVYDIIVRDDPVVYTADKIIWGDTDLFFLYSPQLEEKGYLSIRLFSWEKNSCQ
jgi:hypothetical protein